MFKNLVLFKISPLCLPALGLQSLEDGLAEQPFMPCMATQETSLGWVPPRGVEHGPLVESIGGQWIARLRKETRLLPARVVKDAATEEAKRIENETGRKPGRKQMRELMDECRLTLLPRAFTSQSDTWVWIDPRAAILAIDASSSGVADTAIRALMACLHALVLTPLSTEHSPQGQMAAWLVQQDAPSGFTTDRDCVLKAIDMSGASIRYSKHPLDIEEVQRHVTQGKLPQTLALTWSGKVSFVLTPSLALRRIEMVDPGEESPNDTPQADRFDADVAIATGTLREMIPALVEALGGYAKEATAQEPAAALSGASAVRDEAVPA